MTRKAEQKKYWACSRKEAYSSKEADEVLVRRYVSRGYGGSKYQCPYCGWWHISKSLHR